METKFYAPKGAIHPLAIRTEPGPLTKWDVAENLTRMAVMEKEGLTATEYYEGSETPGKYAREVLDWMLDAMNSDPEIRELVQWPMEEPAVYDLIGEPCVPILEAMLADSETGWSVKTEKEAEAELLLYLNDYNNLTAYIADNVEK